MKITHLCLACFFPDGYSYQENLLPKYHKINGHDVEVIASLLTFDQNGEASYLPKGSTYINENGITVTRLNYKKPAFIYKKLKRFVGLKGALALSAPDILFVHGCQFLDIGVVVKYAKKHKVKIFVDNHADLTNSATNFFSRVILHKIIWRRCAQRILPYASMFWGVLPVRVDFLRDFYGIPSEKANLLIMGADDNSVSAALEPHVREDLRAKFNIAPTDFLVVTGGKIDLFKTQVFLLIESVRRLNEFGKPIKLLVFGSVVPELKERMRDECDGSVIQYAGWVDSSQAYNYFASADLVCFPGRHSVFWEQVVALGIPLLCKKLPGTNHIDLGGNVQFLDNDSVEEINQKLRYCMDNIESMNESAHSDRRFSFFYSEIAKKSIIES